MIYRYIPHRNSYLSSRVIGHDAHGLLYTTMLVHWWSWNGHAYLRRDVTF